jgi:hypothetical protein
MSLDAMSGRELDAAMATLVFGFEMEPVPGGLTVA